MTLIEEIQQKVQQLPPEKQGEVLDFITFLQQQTRAAVSTSSEAERGRRIKEAFGLLAKLQTFADIVDPVEWQRQIRKDKPLPGRDK